MKVMTALAAAALIVGGPAHAAPPAKAAHPRSEMASARAQRLMANWGVMARLPGTTWLEIDGKPTRYLQYQWEAPGEVLTFTGMDRGGNPIAGRYQLDPATSLIQGVSVSKGQAIAAQVQAEADSWTEQGLSAAVRQTVQSMGVGVFQITTTTQQRNGSWRDGKPSQLIQVNQDVVATLGWTQAPPTPSFWAGLLASMKAGAMQGLQDGIHDGVHDRTQCAIAGKKTQGPNCTSQPSAAAVN